MSTAHAGKNASASDVAPQPLEVEPRVEMFLEYVLPQVSQPDMNSPSVGQSFLSLTPTQSHFGVNL